ncbi:hypothetical protein JGS22_007105 [Streptomyces sp. P38-E01]|uniref:Uncharacterized protein n=1 Tax=Streptomyces tardus TaxID=2780544 RepID=A0A949JF38_9ACTN|nr:hypothetical protein [Streptomyces tardus]MBU7597405.1 hypothetical protein [Streptomyces tardus]
MTTETTKPLYSRAVHAPWREILRQRWSGRQDRALVLRDSAGVHHLAGPGRGHRSAPRAVAFEATEAVAEPVGAATDRMRLRGYDAAFHVRLDEQPATRPVAVPTRYGTESMDVHVLWWAHDPVQVVRSNTTHGWLVVRRALGRRLRHLWREHAASGQAFGVPAMMQNLAAPDELPECGLSYRVADISAREDDSELMLGEPSTAGLPYSWTDKSREEYEFCKQAVWDGPVSLVALWLVRHPEQVSQVLDWTVGHADLIRGETSWQDEVAGLLGALTSQERKELSELLRDRLGSLGRRVPEQQGSGTNSERNRVNGWAGGTVKGQPA